jgi:uncharacterized membrane protein YhaH (DUF805 family)
VLRRAWHDYGLSITLAVMFGLAWLLQTLTGWVEYWQSEFLQVFVFIVLTTFLVHRLSHESPDTDYDTEAALRRIEARLVAVEEQLHR